jgi:hypothetical protein
MSEVTPHLYISDHTIARSIDHLRQIGITHIINLCAEYSNFLPNSFEYLRIPAKDNLQERLYPAFPVIARFAKQAADEKGRCLIHCQQGVSRSSTGALACLIINDRHNLDTALAMVKHQHSIAEPNATFLRELRRLECAKFGRWTSGQLFPWDNCEEPVLDWAESITVVLANAERRSLNVDEELGVIDEWFSTGLEAGDDGLEERVYAALIIGLKCTGGHHGKASQTLKDLLKQMLLDTKRCSVKRFKTQLQNLVTSENSEALLLDIPDARSWLHIYISEIPPIG